MADSIYCDSCHNHIIDLVEPKMVVTEMRMGGFATIHNVLEQTDTAMRSGQLTFDSVQCLLDYLHNRLSEVLNHEEQEVSHAR